MASEMLRPQVVSFLDSMLRDTQRAIRVDEAEVGPGSPLVGKTLADVDFHNRVGLVIVAKRQGPRGEYVYNPQASSRLAAGDVLIVCGEPPQVEALRALLAKG